MLMVALALGLIAHPIHTTSASLVTDGGRGRLVVRTFLEDFPPGRDSSAVVRYLADRLTFTAPGGRRLSLVVERIAEAAGVVSVEISVQSPGPWKGTMVHNQLMCDRFKDQVNVVQIKQAGGTRTLLFTPGGRAQVIG